MIIGQHRPKKSGFKHESHDYSLSACTSMIHTVQFACALVVLDEWKLWHDGEDINNPKQQMFKFSYDLFESTSEKYRTIASFFKSWKRLAFNFWDFLGVVKRNYSSFGQAYSRKLELVSCFEE